jgi:hypothetical protein
MKVQQELMHPVDIRTTMNVYGKAMDKSKRKTHRKVSASYYLRRWLNAL